MLKQALPSILSRLQGIVLVISKPWSRTILRSGTRQLLLRLGLRWISPSPIHPKTDPEAQEALRKDFQSLVRGAVGPEVKSQIEIWFQGEACMRQQGILRRIWAL